jgi:hypothetical protein
MLKIGHLINIGLAPYKFDIYLKWFTCSFMSGAKICLI